MVIFDLDIMDMVFEGEIITLLRSLILIMTLLGELDMAIRVYSIFCSEPKLLPQTLSNGGISKTPSTPSTRSPLDPRLSTHDPRPSTYLKKSFCLFI